MYRQEDRIIAIQHVVMNAQAPKHWLLLTAALLAALLLSPRTLLAVDGDLPTVQICNSGNKEFSVASISNTEFWAWAAAEKYKLYGWSVVKPGLVFSSCIYAAGHGGGGTSYYVFAINGKDGKRLIRVTAGNNRESFSDSRQQFCVNPNVSKLRNPSGDHYIAELSVYRDPAICSGIGPGWVLGPPSVALSTWGSNFYKLTIDADEWPVVEAGRKEKPAKASNSEKKTPAEYFALGHESKKEGKYFLAGFYFLAAAEKGHTNAQVELGVLYQNGQGTPQDFDRAAFWYRKAAKQGNAYGQNNLGLLYYGGKGVPQDYIQAFAWLRCAAVQIPEIAVKHRDMVRARMDTDSLLKSGAIGQVYYENFVEPFQ